MPLSHFSTPLTEVCAQINFVRPAVIEFRAASLFEALSSRFSRVEPVPFLLVPPTQTGGPEPAAYRFLNDDGSMMVQFGPTLMAVNAFKWPGFPAFAEIVEWVTRQYESAMPRNMVAGYSLGFYNKVPIQRVSDLPEIFDVQFHIDDRTLEDEFVLQFARNANTGSLLTQFLITPMQQGESTRTIAVNNIVRHVTPSLVALDVTQWMSWLHDAHEEAKDAFWNSLTPDAQSAWEETTRAAG